MDTLVTRLQVGPHNRDQQPWNRQLLMLEKLPSMFPCLREINFDQVRPALRHLCHMCCGDPYLLCSSVLQGAILTQIRYGSGRLRSCAAILL